MKHFWNARIWAATILLASLSFLGACNSATEVTANRESVDNVVTSIEKLNSSRQTVNFKPGKTKQSMTIQLSNSDASKTIQINSISLRSGKSGFALKKLPVFPLSLKPNASISFSVESPAATNTIIDDAIVINGDLVRNIPLSIAAMPMTPTGVVYVETADLSFSGADSFSFVQNVVNASADAVKLTDATTTLTYSSDNGATWTNLTLDDYFTVTQGSLQPSSLAFFPDDEYPISFSSKVSLNPGLYKLITAATYSGNAIISVTGIVTLTID